MCLKHLVCRAESYSGTLPLCIGLVLSCDAKTVAQFNLLFSKALSPFKYSNIHARTHGRMVLVPHVIVPYTKS